MRKVFLVAGTIVLVCVLGVLVFGATQTFTNNMSGPATGIHVVFSASVRIATYDKAVFPTQSPTTESLEFTFSGGELQPGGRFKLSWANEEATVESYEWVGSSSGSGALQYPTAFGIDYSQPEMYLAQGEQTRISNPAAFDWLRGKPKGLAQLGAIFEWLRKFEAYNSGGSNIGTATVDGILASKRLSGCHDFALVFAAVARELGYPAVIVETADVGWITHFRKGEEGPHVGHVFVEVFLTDKWILVDSTRGNYVERGYDPANPVFRAPGGGYYGGTTTGYYVMWKEVDTIASGIHSNEENTAAMDAFAAGVDPTTVTYPAYTWRRFGG